MRIAIPLAGGKLAMHFGHCEQFALFDVDSDNKEIINKDLGNYSGIQNSGVRIQNTLRIRLQ